MLSKPIRAWISWPLFFNDFLITSQNHPDGGVQKRFHIPGKSRFVDLLFTAALGVYFLTRLVTMSTISIHCLGLQAIMGISWGC